MHGARLNQTLIIGLGSHYGADSIGWLAARALLLLDGRLPVAEAAGPSDLFDCMQRQERLILCDGCHGAGEPGSIHHWRWPHIDLKRLKCSGTHDLSLREVLSLAETLGSIPHKIELWGIELPNEAPIADRQWLAQVASRAAAQIYARLNDA